MARSPQLRARPAAGGTADGAQVLEQTALYFESCLWETQIGVRIRSQLAASGIGAEIMRGFRVGYAPGDTRELFDHLLAHDYSPDELIAAGIATESERGRLHVLFHARITFPFLDDGRVRGFAGLATHLGPSWPLWVTSAENGDFDRGASIFGIGQAAPAIGRAQRALVVRDCVQVLALHQAGRREAVAVIHSPITRRHLSQLADATGASRPDLHISRQDGRLGAVVAPTGAAIDAGAFADRAIPAGFTVIRSRPQSREPGNQEVEDIFEADEQPRTRMVVYVASVLIGVGIPIGLLIAAPQDTATSTINAVIGGVTVAYAVLVLIVGRVSARVRASSETRRMREPWARGVDEWQPVGWTYHRLEEILVGAALATALTCVVLLMTVGGFLG